MAQLAISLAGGAIGGALGGPTGARVGFLAGSILGRVLFPEELPDQNVQGPRLGDLSVTASTYGQAIPKAYGTVRMGGNCIWATPIEEVRNVTKQTSGGKGGQEQSVTPTTWSYFGTFALAFCEGQAEDVIRIWADGKLIYDKSSTGSLVRKAGLKFRFYNGSEDQLPDSLIEADVGTGQTPAHRGLVYIVFDSLPLADYGNRRPNITAEIAMASTPAYPFARFEPAVSPIDNYGISRAGVPYDFDRKQMFFYGEESVVSGTDIPYVVKVSSPNLNVVNQKTNASMWTEYGFPARAGDVSYSIMPKAVNPIDGSLYATMFGTSIDDILRIDPNSLSITDNFGAGGTSFGQITTTSFDNPSVLSVIVIENGERREAFLIAAPGGGDFGIVSCPDANNGSTFQYVSGVEFSGPSAFPWQIIQTQKFVGQTEAIFITYNSDIIYFRKIKINSGAYYDDVNGATSGVSLSTLLEITPAVLNANPDIIHNITGIQIATDKSSFGYDEDTNSIIGHWSFDDSSVPTFRHYALSINAENGNINWATFLGSGTATTGQGGSMGDLSKSQYVRIGITNNDYFTIDKFNGSIVEEFDPVTWFVTNEGTGRIAVDQDFNAMIMWQLGGAPDQEGGIMYFDRASGNGATLSSIVTSLSLDAGLSASDIDVTDLADTTVLGYLISRPTTVRGGLQPLSQAYFFDGIESDYKLNYIDRGGSSVATIPEQDLASLSDNEYWVQERNQEQDMPMRMTVQYMDFERDYQEGTQTSKRAQSPFPVMQSKNEVTTGLPIVLDDSEAKQIVEKWLYNTWQERDGYKTALSWEYLKLNPADIVTVNFDDGTTYKVRLATVDFGANLALGISALSEETANYTTSGIAAENNFTASTIKGASAQTYLKVHNVPLLADTHDQARVSSVLYAQAGPLISGASWNGATLYSSTDQVTWTPVTRITNELTYGSVSGTLAAPSDVFAVDTTNSLTIWPTSGGDNLESITYAQLLAGALNIAIVGSEVINFQNVTDNGDGSYTLDTFLRGRRGTDTAASSHASGEYFYLINDTNAEGFVIPLANIDSPMYFKAVGDGQTLEEATTQTLTPTGEDLKPYAPINAQRNDSGGDITITWDRRTRINGDGSGTMPLNEDSESYSIDILSGSGGSVLRTLTASSETVTYTAAQITSDFGITPNPLYVRIYQVSAQVGRGKSYEWELYQ